MRFNKILQSFHTPSERENEQAAKGQNRLSKPKTKSSTNLLTVSDTAFEPSSTSPASASRTSTFSDTEAVIAALPGQHQVRSDARQKLRAQLFNLSTSSDTEYAVEDEGDIVSPDGDESGNGNSEQKAKGNTLNKSNSFSTRLSAARASSSTLLTTLTGSRLSLVPESQILASDNKHEQDGLAPEELEEIEDKIRMGRRTSAHRLSMPTSLTRDETGSATIRGKSFLIPGIATRGGTGHPLRKRAPPTSLSTDQDRDYYYNPSIPESSPLSKLASMDVTPGGAPSSLPRPLTPNENLEYSFLAGFKRGSLRITNGAASPAPSLDSVKSAEHDDRNDEAFFSASEGLRSDDERAQPSQTTLVRRHSSVYTRYENEYEQETEDSVYTCYGQEHHWEDEPQVFSRPSVSIRTSKTRYRAQSPLRFDGQKPNRRNTSRIRSETGTILRRKSFSSSEANSTPDKTLSMAQEYQEELSSSAMIFDESPVPSPKLQATSKMTEFEADLFESDYEGSLFGSELGSVRGGTREAAFRILDGEASPPSESQNLKLSSGMLDTDLMGFSNEMIEKPLAKADSGYSSTTSVRSSHHDRNGQLIPGVPPDFTVDPMPRQGHGIVNKELPPAPPIRPAPTLPAAKPENRIPRKALPNVSDRALSGFFEMGLNGIQRQEPTQSIQNPSRASTAFEPPRPAPQSGNTMHTEDTSSNRGPILATRNLSRAPMDSYNGHGLDEPPCIECMQMRTRDMPGSPARNPPAPPTEYFNSSPDRHLPTPPVGNFSSSPARNPPMPPTDNLNTNINNQKELPCLECAQAHDEEQQQITPVESKRKSGSVANARKKLQKPRPKAQAVSAQPKFITVQRYREIEQQHIPPIPSEIVTRYAGRPKEWAALEQSSHKSQPYTVQVPLDPAPEPQPPSWKFPIFGKSRHQSDRRHSAFAETGQDSFSNSRPKPTRSSTEANRHSQESQWQREEAATGDSGITDFGTVAQSLGSSPYDAALGESSWRQRRDSGQRSFSPYQMGAMPRSRSSVGMTEEEASEFGRERSMMRRTSGPRNFSRPRSMHESGGISNGNRNRHSLEYDGPVFQGERGRSQPRPLSMIAGSPSIPPPPVPTLPRAYSYANTKRAEEEDEVERNTRMNRTVNFHPQIKDNSYPQDRHVDFSRASDRMPPTATQGYDAQSGGWAQHSAAWTQRRRSAGEALGAAQAASASASTAPGIGNSTNIHGRYDGGFGYGYEAGQGCGGSAGTRSMTTNASRKSIGVSQDYGIDLSDVPVFIRG